MRDANLRLETLGCDPACFQHAKFVELSFAAWEEFRVTGSGLARGELRGLAKLFPLGLFVGCEACWDLDLGDYV